jgi:hypothetical protein
MEKLLKIIDEELDMMDLDADSGDEWSDGYMSALENIREIVEKLRETIFTSGLF